jgi:hypothetical protein
MINLNREQGKLFFCVLGYHSFLEDFLIISMELYAPCLAPVKRNAPEVKEMVKNMKNKPTLVGRGGSASSLPKAA